MIGHMEFDRKADAIYISFSDKQVAYTKKLDDFRYVDFDDNDSVVGIELLNISNVMQTNNLPDKAEIDVGLKQKGIKTYA